MKKSLIASLILVIAIISFTGCKKNNGGNKTASSTHNSTSSKKMSGVCQSCHISGGEATGWWTVAGTVYTEDLSAVAPNGTINFYTGPDGSGDIVATLEIDAYGNFYTSNSILPAAGTYPRITGTSGNSQTMPQICTSGNCNSCHGVTCAKIWIN
jgi:hypothetical protein